MKNVNILGEFNTSLGLKITAKINDIIKVGDVITDGIKKYLVESVDMHSNNASEDDIVGFSVIPI